MAAFMGELLQMSVRGIVLIWIVMGLRFLLGKLGVDHKYIVGLWMMVFLFLVIPWKISLPVGFWGNAAALEERFSVMDAGGSRNHGDNAGGIRDGADRDAVGNADADHHGDHLLPAGNAGTQGSMADIDEASKGDGGAEGGSAAQAQGMTETPLTMPGNPETRDAIIAEGTQKENPMAGKGMDILAAFWLTGLCAGIGYMLYSYLRLKKKLMLCIPYQENVWWAEDIDMPMVFGPVFPQVYLPVGLEEENLSYVIAHEKMHIRRKDGFFKMAAYMICLLHWFNPFIWAAYILLGSDLEKACDEEVIRSMEKEKRKEYARALIRIASGNGKRKRKVFVAPVGYDEGNLKSRVKNVMKYQYMLPGLGAVVVVVIIALSALFMTEAKEPADTPTGENSAPEAERNEGSEGDGEAGNGGRNGSVGQDDSNESGKQDGIDEAAFPVFYVNDLDSLRVSDPFSMENFYITNRWVANNHYYIDENGVLWGTGENVYGQLATGTYGFREEEYYEEPVKIAENVVSVDASWNGYFCIYLTENGELYGVGLNFGGILLGKGSETVGQIGSYQKITEPVLLMTDVAYARTGRECIVALQTDGSAYWWGEYSSTTLSHVPYFEDFWSLEEDDTNPAKMYACEPRKIMDDCVYIATGTYTGAVINEAGEMYAWGLNLFGQCGVPVTEEDDYIREPVKVMDDVKMVWMERIAFNDPEDGYTFYTSQSTDYVYNIFLLKEDNTLMAAGLDLGDKEKITELTGDIAETDTHRYGDEFLPVRAVEYTPELHMQVLRELEFGLSLEETENALIHAGQNIYRTTRERPYRTDLEGICLCARYHQYVCVFDDQDRLESILIEEGGSRDGRFMCGMSLSELREAVESAGGELAGGTDGEYFYEDVEQNVKYVYEVYEDVLESVWEIAMD